MAYSREPKTAAEWMARLRRGGDPRDRESYGQWLDASPENRASAEQLDLIWESVGTLGDDPLVQSVLATPPRQQRGVWQTILAPPIAAAAVLCLTLVASLFIWRHFDASKSYETASGEQRVVKLADGSRLHLNVTTRMEVALRSDVRDVRLVHGQAFFDVVPDPNRPFVVIAGDKEITVLGTKFDVLVQGGDTRVTVIEGRVAVTPIGSTGDQAPPTSPPRLQSEPTKLEELDSNTQPASVVQRLELTARDAVSWPRSAPPKPLEPQEAVAAVETWRSGRVVFDSTPLRQAVDELDRYTPVQVRLAADELGSMTVSGVFYVDRLAKVDSLIFALENSLPIVVERSGDELILWASS